MKVLILRDSTRSLTGGIKKHCSDLYELFKDDSDINIQNIIDLPCKFIPLLRKYIVNYSTLKKYIKNSQCNTIHIHGFMSILALEAIYISKRLKKRIIYSTHFHPFKYLDRPILGILFYHTLLKPLLKYVDTIITINNEDTTFFSSFHKNVKKIPHWLEKENSSEKISHTNSMILFVGRNDSNKGIEHLYSLPPNKYEIHCVTGGILKRRDFIQHQNLSNNELKELYKQANVVVVPSRYEAFSLVALEALANHTPIVISDRVKIADYLSNNKHYQIFKYGNYKEFEKAINEILNQTQKHFDDTILLPFSKEKIKSTYKSIYTNN